MKYKRLTTTQVVNGRNIKTVTSKGKVTLQDLIDRLYDIEEKIENGTLIELPCVRKLNFSGIECVEAVYIQHNGTVGECVCLNETEAEKMLEEIRNGNNDRLSD